MPGKRRIKASLVQCKRFGSSVLWLKIGVLNIDGVHKTAYDTVLLSSDPATIPFKINMSMEKRPRKGMGQINIENAFPPYSLLAE